MTTQYTSTVAVKELLGFDTSDNFNSVAIKIASPDVIHSWSRGEVKNPETINYRTFKPEKGGLFCEKIFGPTRDWDCGCGKCKGIKYKGIVCDRCGVEVTHSRVRRERMGHIDLAVPISHIWFFKCMPSRIGLLLDMTTRNLERVIYYEFWIVIDAGDTPLTVKQLLTDEEYQEAEENYANAFKADIGASAIRQLLINTNLKELRDDLNTKMKATKSKTVLKKNAKRLRLVEGLLNANMRPEWMILTKLPVIPPDLRPLVPLEGGRFATSDLNDLYRRVINRNNRLKNLLNPRTPEIIIRNEKRMLQEAIDALLDNGRHGRVMTGAGSRPLKSLSSILKGKHGRFRQNLLGKRVDYSGRSVIVVGPELKLNQCGLPKKMALILFEPFIIRKLRERGYCHTVRSAKKIIEKGDSYVWDILEEVTKGHPILLNRAPTLHRLSIQAFDPVLIEGNAIRVHPLVCAAYNADFDGDQMAVHIPLSIEAQLEAKLLMLASKNTFYPSNGRPIAVPSQDITLGAYFLTYARHEDLEKKKRPDAIFVDMHEAIRAYEVSAINIHEPILLRNLDFNKDTLWGDKENRFLKTTAGRCIFNRIWTSSIGFFNQIANKSNLSELVADAYAILGSKETVLILDQLKELCYEYATYSGFSIATCDMIIPKDKDKIVEEGHEQIEVVRKQYQKGVITKGEFYNKSIDIWMHVNNRVALDLFQVLERNGGSKEINPIWAMLDSGSRGSKDQVRQLAGMRGLMAKPSGQIIERPILSNFRDGLTVLEFFISSHGARKGLADTALKTADSGYLTRKLVDVAHDIICKEEDCLTHQGIYVSAILEGDEEMLPLKQRIMGRYSVDNIPDPFNKDKCIIAAGEEITKQIADQLVNLGIERVYIRSVLTCHTESGICRKCYGRNLASNGPTKIGDAVGIIAAQSIGEPGTQLTMRTFHVGGTASSFFKQPNIKARIGGKMELLDARTVEANDGTLIILNSTATVVLSDDGGCTQERYELIPSSILQKAPGTHIKKDEIFVKWDPYNISIISEYGGKTKFVDLVEGITMKEQVNEMTGNRETLVLQHQEDLLPQILIVDNKGKEFIRYSIPVGAHLMVSDNTSVSPGQTLARTPRQSTKTTDITGGLPRVSELFEARQPKDAAKIAQIDGIVKIGDLVKGKRRLVIQSSETQSTEKHLIPIHKHIVVLDGESVRKGQPLTEGSVISQELLEVCGPQDMQEYLVNEVQKIYRLQGVEINDKHIEIIVRQMLQKVRITASGDTPLLYGEQVDRSIFAKENARMIAEGKRPAEGQPLLLGITKAALENKSFISAASFQDTPRILTEAATIGKIDPLHGFKENVIMGHLIPAGTGHNFMSKIKLKKVGKEIIPEPEGFSPMNNTANMEDNKVSRKSLYSLKG